MIVFIFYDIVNDRIRSKIANRLLAEGYERIQLSVFTGTEHPRENQALWQDLQAWISGQAKDRFYVVRTSISNFRQMAVIGSADWDMDYLAGSKNSLFI